MRVVLPVGGVRGRGADFSELFWGLVPGFPGHDREPRVHLGARGASHDLCGGHLFGKDFDRRLHPQALLRVSLAGGDRCGKHYRSHWHGEFVDKEHTHTCVQRAPVGAQSLKGYVADSFEQRMKRGV